MERRKFRHELKYLVSPGVHRLLSNRIKAAVKPDPHGAEYRNTSLYFDDIYHTAYGDKLLGMSSRKKYRIRVYNLSRDIIHLEEKLKENDFVAKKSARLTYEEYRRLLGGDSSFLAEERFCGTAAEDFYISDSLVRLRPAVVVDYFREAYVCAAGNVRITFDKSLSVGSSADMLAEKPVFTSVFPDGSVILEVKYDSFLPAYIGELFSGVPLTRESVSKFMYCTDMLTGLCPSGYTAL